MAEDSHINFISASIGNICIQWANLEGIVAVWIWILLKLDGDTGAIVTGGLDMLPRLNMAIALSRHKRLPNSLINPLVHTRKAIQDGLGDRRNQAVHGIHSDGSSADSVKLTMHRWSGDKRTQELKINEIRNLGTEINAVAKQLSLALDQLIDFTDRRTIAMPNKMASTAEAAPASGRGDEKHEQL